MLNASAPIEDHESLELTSPEDAWSRLGARPSDSQEAIGL